MIATCAGRKARFCGEACRDGLATDRRYGAIYPAVHAEDGAYSVERWSLVALCCAYCGADVAGRAKDLPPNWPKAVRATEVQS